MKILLQLKDLSSIAFSKSEKYSDLEKALARKSLEYHNKLLEKSEETNELFQAIYSSFCMLEKKGFVLRFLTKRNNESQKIKDNSGNN